MKFKRQFVFLIFLFVPTCFIAGARLDGRFTRKFLQSDRTSPYLKVNKNSRGNPGSTWVNCSVQAVLIEETIYDDELKCDDETYNRCLDAFKNVLEQNNFVPLLVENCNNQTAKNCRRSLTSNIVFVNQCLDVFTEKCRVEKVNPRKVIKSVVLKWCSDANNSSNDGSSVESSSTQSDSFSDDATNSNGENNNDEDDVDSNSDGDSNMSIIGQWEQWSEFSACSLTCGVGIKTRTRICNNASLTYGLDCEGKSTENVRCIDTQCPINGGLSDWILGSECSSICSDTEGLEMFTKVCDNPRPQFGGKPCPRVIPKFGKCFGTETPQNVDENGDCYRPIIDGQWSEWTEFGSCSLSCGNGFQTRSRFCNNPPPSNGGLICAGETFQHQDCNITPCPIDGGLSDDWTLVSECSSECLGEEGHITFQRLCNNPTPQFNGEPCKDIPTKYELCFGTAIPQTDDEEKDCYKPYWHMIIGGNDGSSITDTVELLNWKTGEQCSLSSRLPIPLSEHSGAVINQVPVICGGISIRNERQRGCYHFNKTDQTWSNAPELPEITNRAGSTYIPSRGWYLFGGAKSSQNSSLAFEPPFTEWTYGPSLFKFKSSSDQCVVQLNDATTVFIGGNRNSFDIVLLDWNNASYTTSSQLQLSRQNSACALFKSKTGEDLVAIVGGSSEGMEVWNPTDGTVELLFDRLPSETDDENGSLDFAQLLPINEGRELLLYGGNQRTERDNRIWKYSSEDNTWTQFKTMLSHRGEHVVLAVPGVTCPQIYNRG